VSQERLHAMAFVHDLLQQADNVPQINLAHYAAHFTEELARTYAIDPERITLETELEDVWVGLDTATPCGLLLHELLTNCFKHALPEGRRGAYASSSAPRPTRRSCSGSGIPAVASRTTLTFGRRSPSACSWFAPWPSSCKGLLPWNARRAPRLRFSYRWRPRRLCRDPCRRRAGRHLA
jgi:hypothetical protein